VCQSRPAQTYPTGSNNAWAAPVIGDSSAVVSIDLERWTADTLFHVRSTRTRIVFAEYGPGEFGMAPLINPLPAVDEWALLSDGTFAVVRSAEYRIDRVRRDGSVISSHRLPHAPIQLSGDQKARLVDSLQAVIALRQTAGDSNRIRPTLRDPAAPPPQHSDIRSLLIVVAQVSLHPDAAARWQGRQMSPLFVMPPGELPDVLPPFKPGGVRVDLDGNVWILTNESNSEGSLYHVVNGAGQLIARISIPRNRVIVGFGRGGALYVAVTPSFERGHLERFVVSLRS
jgi:hypothetical protein